MIENKIIECENVKNALEKFCADKKVSPQTVDFDLIDIKTLVGEKGLQKEEIDLAAANAIEKSSWINPDFEIMQRYKIRVREKQNGQKFAVTLHADKSFSKMFAILRKGSVIEDKKLFTGAFLSEIDKKKALHGVLIGVYENQNLESEIESFLQQIANAVDQDKRFLISVSASPITPTQNQHVIYDYKKDTTKKQYDKDRGFLWMVSKGQPILTVVRPIQGISGRNCYGKYVEAPAPVVTIQGRISASPLIKTRDIVTPEGNAVQYVAEETGVVEFDEFRQRLELKRRVVLDGIDFKKTGDINLAQDEDVELVIKSLDSNSDSIGLNTAVVVKNLTVDGHVGEGANINAQTLNVTGSTHASSVITGKKVSVNVHKGRIEAQEVEIKNLEGGTVEGERVVIENALGGVIKGKEIVIKNLYDNLTISGSQSISIENPMGHNNTICVEFGIFGEELVGAEIKREELQNLKIDLKEKKLLMEERKKFYEKNKSSFEGLVIQIKESKKFGREPSLAAVRAVENFVKTVGEMKTIGGSMVELGTQIRETTDELISLEDRIFDSTIQVNGGWKKGNNKIVFKTLFPRREIIFSPHEGQLTKKIFLKRNSETDNLEIRVDNDDDE